MGDQQHNAASVSLPVYAGTPHECPYLPNRTATNEFIVATSLEAGMYQQLMDAGFRRSGEIVYRPVCDGCRECVPIRVPVATFLASRSQWRAAEKNRDVRVEIGPPLLTDDKWRIYEAYQREQHDGAMNSGREEMEAFLYRSPTTTEEFAYWVGDRVIASGIVDVTPEAMSSVYFYFDPAEGKRSLGVFSVLREIEECRSRGLPFWYGGYYVQECRKMSYKAQYKPYELLGDDGVWRAG